MVKRISFMKYIMGIFVPTYPIILENAAIFNPCDWGSGEMAGQNFHNNKTPLPRRSGCIRMAFIKWTIRGSNPRHPD